MNKVGLIAGSGKFPVLFAREAKKNGCSVFVAGLKTVSPELERLADACEVFKLGQVAAPIKFFKRHGVAKAAMCGLVKHGSIFSGLMPDLRAAAILARIKDMRAETIFREAAAELAKDGIELISSATFLSGLIPGAGLLTKTAPGETQRSNIKLGWTVAKTLAGLDVGLTAVLCDMAVVALEGMEGTDACILRAGKIYRDALEDGLVPGKKTSGLVVVKVARERQDFRFDLPVIGKGTIESMEKAGAPVLAIEAGKTIIIDREEVVAKAGELGISVIALDSADKL